MFARARDKAGAWPYKGLLCLSPLPSKDPQGKDLPRYLMSLHTLQFAFTKQSPTVVITGVRTMNHVKYARAAKFPALAS